MKTSKWFVITLAAALSTGGFMVLKARAAELPLAQRHLRGQFLERAKDKLGLSDDQVAQIKAQLLAEKETLKSLIANLHDARAGLRTAIQAPDGNESSVRAASAKVAAIQADLAVERFKLCRRISPILTDQQREKVNEFQSRIDDFVDRAISRIGERLTSQ